MTPRTTPLPMLPLLPPPPPPVAIPAQERRGLPWALAAAAQHEAREERLVYGVLRKLGPASLPDLAIATGLPSPRVSVVLLRGLVMGLVSGCALGQRPESLIHFSISGAASCPGEPDISSGPGATPGGPPVLPSSPLAAPDRSGVGSSPCAAQGPDHAASGIAWTQRCASEGIVPHALDGSPLAGSTPADPTHDGGTGRQGEEK